MVALVNEKKNTPCRINPLFFSLLSSLFYPSLFIPLLAVFFLWFGSLPCCNAFYSPPSNVGRLACLRRDPSWDCPLFSLFFISWHFFCFVICWLFASMSWQPNNSPLYCVCVLLCFCLMCVCMCYPSFPYWKPIWRGHAPLSLYLYLRWDCFFSIINPKKTAWVCLC